MKFCSVIDGPTELRPQGGNAAGRWLLLEESDAATGHVAQTGAQTVELRLQLLCLKKKDKQTKKKKMGDHVKVNTMKKIRKKQTVLESRLNVKTDIFPCNFGLK